MNSNCPMTKEVQLTDKQVENFCKRGCSVDCKNQLDAYLKKAKRRGEQAEQI